jgi:hypothetical protein
LINIAPAAPRGYQAGLRAIASPMAAGRYSLFLFQQIRDLRLIAAMRIPFHDRTV